MKATRGAAGRSERLRGKFFTPALLDARSALHLSYRLTVRLVQFIADDGAAAAGAGWWRAALPLFAVWDVVLYFILRRSDRYGLAWRLPLDALDIGFWSISPLPLHRRTDNALVIAIPLAIEGGFRLGARALVVPVVGYLVPILARWAMGQPAQPKGFGVEWLVIGVGLGMGLYRYCLLLNTQADRHLEQRRAADDRRAYLAGQNSVAMGASSVVDAIEGVVPILGPPSSGSALGQLADGWKAQLGSSTSLDATYLHVAVLEWEREYNRHPDLSTNVVASVVEGDGTLLLTGSQVQDLGRTLTALGPRGETRIALADPAAPNKPPGLPVSLLVDGRTVELAGDRQRPRRPVDPGPVAFVFLAAALLHDASPDWAEVPAAVVAFGVATYVAAAFWAHRQLVRDGLQARPRILYGAMLVGLPYTVLATLTLHQAQVPGTGTAYIVGGSLMILSFLLGGYDEILTPRLVKLALLAAAANVVLAVGLSRAPVSPRAILLMLAYGLTPYWPFRRISTALSQASRDHADAVGDEDEQAEMAAFERGRADVVDLVRRAHNDAQAQLAAVAPSLEPDVARAVARRLGDVDQRLASLG